mgnify:CR=1 FL=1
MEVKLLRVITGEEIVAEIVDEEPEDLRIETGNSDDVGVIRTYNNSALQARLYTALQTALSRIEALEAEVTALRSK